MRRVFATLVLASLPALPARSAGPARPTEPTTPLLQEPVFRTASSELVVLPVIVTDRHGAYVSNLGRDAFSVYDNGRLMPVDLFSKEDTPVTVGLVIDASSSMRSKIGEVVAAAMTFVRLSNPDDELFAIRFNDDVATVTERMEGLNPPQAEDVRQALLSIRPEGRTALYDALVAGLDRLDRGTRARKVLILISDGGDNMSHATRTLVLDRARRSNASIYTVGLFDDFDPDRNPRLLKSLAHDTGGERFLPASAGPLITACERIAREIRAGYTIGYAPPDHDGAFHHVRVLVRASDGRRVDIRTRPGYFAAARN